MKYPSTAFPFPALALALALLGAITGCTKQVDAAKYNAVQWTNSINAPGLSESEFTRLFALRAAAEIPGSKVRITGTREITINVPGGGELKQFLDNAWADAKATPSDRADVCARYLASLLQTQKAMDDSSGPLDTNSIVAVIRDDEFLKQFEKIGSKTNRIVVEPLVADLHVAYGRDSERGMAYLMEKDAAQLGSDSPSCGNWRWQICIVFWRHRSEWMLGRFS